MSSVLIVGAGFSGAVIARELASAGHEVTIIDSRNHIAGNAYDYANEHGIKVHKYGPHIFHTSNARVFDYLSHFTEWTVYFHKVKAILSDGQYVTLPVNKKTAEIVGAENVIDTFIRPYTKKMWGKEIEELDPSILQRVPIRDDMNELYFPNDTIQVMPTHGYTKLIFNMLEHPNIKVKLDSPFKKSMMDEYDHVFNSQPIDEFFDYQFGELPYRSIKFHHVTLPSPKVLPEPCINFTHDGPYTRMTEWKNFPNHGVNNNFTTITYEEPCDYKENNMERYYPVKDLNGENRATYEKYAAIVPSNVTFIGRCGQYAYLDMHQAVSSALAISRKFLSKD